MSLFRRIAGYLSLLFVILLATTHIYETRTGVSLFDGNKPRPAPFGPISHQAPKPENLAALISRPGSTRFVLFHQATDRRVVKTITGEYDPSTCEESFTQDLSTTNEPRLETFSYNGTERPGPVPERSGMFSPVFSIASHPGFCTALALLPYATTRAYDHPGYDYALEQGMEPRPQVPHTSVPQLVDGPWVMGRPTTDVQLRLFVAPESTEEITVLVATTPSDSPADILVLGPHGLSDEEARQLAASTASAL